MAAHNDLGTVGESIAAKYLRTAGYKILETNWIFQKAEIDIIASYKDTLAIVEVKTRSGTDFGLPQDFVNAKKIRLLVKAVNEYVLEKNLDIEIRFDIIAISKNSNGFHVEHIKDAFYHF